MDWFLSVDGGGTKTALLLRRADGGEYRARSGASSIKSVGGVRRPAKPGPGPG